MRRHHEEIAAASALVPAVSALIPITIAIWIRVKEWRGPIAAAGGRRESEVEP